MSILGYKLNKSYIIYICYNIFTNVNINMSYTMHNIYSIILPFWLVIGNYILTLTVYRQQLLLTFIYLLKFVISVSSVTWIQIISFLRHRQQIYQSTGVQCINSKYNNKIYLFLKVLCKSITLIDYDYNCSSLFKSYTNITMMITPKVQNYGIKKMSWIFRTNVTCYITSHINTKR